MNLGLSMSKVLLNMMKTNHSSFELIPEEEDIETVMDNGDSSAAGAGAPAPSSAVAAAAAQAAAAQAAAQQAAITARILQVQQQNFNNGQLTLPDLALHQHFFSQQLLQEQLARNREFLLQQQQTESSASAAVEREKQLGLIFQQVEAQRKAKEAAVEVHHEKMKLEILKQKSRQEQSAVASPEVKRHLAEFVLQKKRKEAAVSMSNLKIVPTANPPPPHHALLRKTASESNLLKMKPGKRSSAHGTSSPYQRYHHQPIPENEVQGGSLQDSPVGSAESSGSSVMSGMAAMRPIDLGMASVRQELAARTGSAPTSPKTSLISQMNSVYSASNGPQVHPLNLHRPSPYNVELLRSSAASSAASSSKSLPNIPSAMGRLSKEHATTTKVVGRKSPPAALSAGSKQMLVRRSKSSAILPLRKHLIEKTMAEQQQKAAAAAAAAQALSMDKPSSNNLVIRPIEEIMEEDTYRAMTSSNEHMDVDDQSSPPRSVLRHSFAARLGHAGLSPLVINDVSNTKLTQEYLNRFMGPPPSSQSMMMMSTAMNMTGRTGLGFDPAMLRHECLCGDNLRHPENPRRLQSIWSHLVATGLADQCVKVSREATLEEIRSVHSEAHTILYGVSSALNATSGKFQLLKCGGMGVDSDTYWNENHTSMATKVAAGTVVELSTMVARGDLKNGLALVRPPGHHAEYEEAMGFCYFNSVAIAAKQLIMRKLAHRVLIVDWAIHHGNGTQRAFYDNPNVLYISLHRHDHGNFYPGTGSPIECGSGAGLGFNVNIAWAGGLSSPMADAEYLAAFRSIVLPIAHSFDPDIVLVSAGFDAAIGHPHPIGGYSVSTACFALLTLQLRQLAHGRVVLALEGGFNEEVLNTATEQCLSALLGNKQVDKIAPEELARRPNAAAVETLQKTLAIQSPYWEVLRRYPEAALTSHIEAWEKEQEQTEALRAMAGLSMKQHSMSSQGSSCSIVDDVDADASMA